MIKKCIDILEWLIGLTLGSNDQGEAKQVLRLLKTFIRKQDKVLRTRGPNSLIEYNKEVRVALMNYLSGSPSEHKGLSLTKDGIPRCLGDLIPLLRREDSPETVKTLPMITTVLWNSRLLKSPPVLNLESIITP